MSRLVQPRLRLRHLVPPELSHTKGGRPFAADLDPALLAGIPATLDAYPATPVLRDRGFDS